MAKKDEANPNLEQSSSAPDLQDAKNEADAQGFYGRKVDPTPNEHYSLETGPDAPTPETDADAARKAHVDTHIASRFPASKASD